MVQKKPGDSVESAEESLRRSEERFRQLAENIREVFYILTAGTGQMEYISPTYDEVFGRSSSELYEHPGAWLESVIPEDREFVTGSLDRIRRGGAADIEYRIVRPDGTLRWLRARTFPVRDATGKVVRMVGIAEDITGRVQRELALTEARAQLQRSLESARMQAEENATMTEFLDVLQSCRSADEAYRIVAAVLPTVLATSKGALCITRPSRNLVDVVSEWGDQPGTQRTFEPDECWALRRGKLQVVRGLRSPTRCAHVEGEPSGGYICVPLAAHGETIGVVYMEGYPASAGAGATQEDESQSLSRGAEALGERMSLALANIQLRDELKVQAIRDPLTGLFNRRYMEESLEREVQRAMRNKGSVGVLMIDLDRFKQFNDSFGHEAGDTVLRAIGDFLIQHTRGQDVACRYGGEEFTLILSGATAEGARLRAEALLRDLKDLIIRHAGETLERVTLSIGGAAYPDQATGGDLLRAADRALYQAKAEGRDRFVMG